MELSRISPNPMYHTRMCFYEWIHCFRHDQGATLFTAQWIAVYGSHGKHMAYNELEGQLKAYNHKSCIIYFVRDTVSVN
jgi:hypothetical protein